MTRGGVNELCQRDRRTAEDEEDKRRERGQKRLVDNNTEIEYALLDRRKASS
jgi:hypothetical protein